MDSFDDARSAVETLTGNITHPYGCADESFYFVTTTLPAPAPAGAPACYAVDRRTSRIIGFSPATRPDLDDRWRLAPHRLGPWPAPQHHDDPPDDADDGPVHLVPAHD